MYAVSLLPAADSSAAAHGMPPQATRTTINKMNQSRQPARNTPHPARLIERSMLAIFVIALHFLLLIALLYLPQTTAPQPPTETVLEVSLIMAQPSQPQEQPAAPVTPPPPPPPPPKEPPKPQARPQVKPKIVRPQPTPAPAPQPAVPTESVTETPPAEPVSTAATSPASTETATATSAPNASTAQSAPPPVTPPIYNANYLNNPKPNYPSISTRLGEEGRVLLRVLVSEDGFPSEIEQIQSSGSERLDNAAREAVKRWRFVPARQGERKIKAWVQVPIDFRL